MKTIAIYPGTFDPITFGHIDLVERAAQLFDHIIIAIAENSDKTPLFSLVERVDLANKVFKGMKNIEIIHFSELLADFARTQQANVILRGLRVISDFDYEFQMASLNRKLNKEVETVFLTPGDRYTYVSSSLVREIARKGGDVSAFVPSIVEEALHLKMGLK